MRRALTVSQIPFRISDQDIKISAVEKTHLIGKSLRGAGPSHTPECRLVVEKLSLSEVRLSASYLQGPILFITSALQKPLSPSISPNPGQNPLQQPKSNNPKMEYAQTVFSAGCGFPVHASFMSFFEGRTMRFKPSQGVLTGESPVKMNRS